MNLCKKTFNKQNLYLVSKLLKRGIEKVHKKFSFVFLFVNVSFITTSITSYFQLLLRVSTVHCLYQIYSGMQSDGNSFGGDDFSNLIASHYIL